MANKFHHFGVPTDVQSENEIYLEGGRVYITDPESHPYKIEYLRFEPGSPMPEILKTTCHAAFMVDSIEEALAGKEVVMEPFDATETLTVAFFKDGDALIEVMKSK